LGSLLLPEIGPARNLNDEKRVLISSGGNITTSFLKENPMFKHILVPTDGSKLSDQAVKQAIDIAKALGAKITALVVMPDYEIYVSERYNVPVHMAAPVKEKYEEEEAARAKRILAPIKEAAKVVGVECDVATVISDTPYKMIIDQAARFKCDLIIMASHGRRGLEGILLGSVTQKVLTHSKIPVLVCR
jgi:nucleotide-binding universal stress UspA family protein